MSARSATLAERAALRLQAAWLRPDWLSDLLWPLGLVIGGLAAARRLAYSRGWLASHDCGVPVIVVGNLVAGGAGKTPTVLALVDALKQAGHRPGIVSRGHGRLSTPDDVLLVEADLPASLTGDEPLLLRRRSGVPVVVARDRVAAVRALRAVHPAISVVVSDDGLQHRALARTVELVVFDERGVGNGRCLPAGPLREPMPVDAPPRTVVVYNASTPTTAWPGRLLRRELTRAASLDDWWTGGQADAATLQALRGRTLIAVAGTARPGRFFTALEAAGLSFTALPLPDHHPFETLPWPAGSIDVIVTEKDAVKLAGRPLGEARVWVAPLDCRLDPQTVEAVLSRLSRPVPRPSPVGSSG